jgi:hypothetical protein
VPLSQAPWKDRRRFAYVVVDEIESNLVGLSLSPWPTVDEWGRLRFGVERARSIGAGRAELQTFLRRHRLPRKGAERPLRIGDVFAVALREPAPTDQIADPTAWIDPPVYDVSADARDAAKASFYSAVAPTLDPKADAQVLALATKKKPTQASSGRRTKRAKG